VQKGPAINLRRHGPTPFHHEELEANAGFAMPPWQAAGADSHRNADLGDNKVKAGIEFTALFATPDSSILAL
jgi:hypothetical protein